jgi:predicted nucleic acid-binding protein
MSLEPGIIDANIRVYAMAVDAPQYAASRALLDAARDDPATTLYVTSQKLCEFYSVVTNPRRVTQARSTTDALQAIFGFLAFLHVLPIPARAVEGWLDLLRRRPVTGADVF